MDFTNRSAQSPANQPVPTATNTTNSAPVRSDRLSKKNKTGKWLQISGVVLLFSVTILAVAAIGILALGSRDQAKFVNTKKYQAVFLTNGQVYFGNIKEMGSDFFRLQNIYYLQAAASTNTTSNATATNNNYTLVQLGCQQIHDPYNEMIINRNQISFWENLQDNGQVVQKINQFNKQYPNGPDCTQVSSQTQASTDSSTTNSTPSSTGTDNTTKKP